MHIIEDDNAGVAPQLTEEQVRAAVQDASVPALLMTVYQATGDEHWLDERYRPTRGRGLNGHESGGLPDEIQAEIRNAAVPVILDMQAGKAPAIAVPSPELTTRLMSIYLGEAVDPRYGPMISEELARRSAVGAANVEHTPLKAPDGYRVIVIGVGIAGIAAIHYLEQSKVDYTVFERQPEVGGNWFQNTYPGAGVDTPSHLYSFSFVDRDWKEYFALRDSLEEYFGETLDSLGARDRVQFETTVLSADFDEESERWHVRVRGADGVERDEVADIVISAVGVLNKPKLPPVPGLETFKGTSFHSSFWPKDLDLSGKRVAIVGTGASSMQISPAIAPTVAHLTIFQRSPQWVAPFEQFRQEIPEGTRQLLANNRIFHAWYWLRLFWQFGDKVIEALRVDPNWEHPERSVNARNDGHRIFFTKYLQARLADRPDLVPKVLPDYPPFGKRILLDNGWYTTLLRDNVSLVNEAVVSVDETGLVSADGVKHEVDVIIWATGFDAARFVSSFEVHGKDGARLRDVWEDDNPKAYLGVSVPGFPNFFMLGGPNSFPGSGSFMYFMEVQMRYIRGLLDQMLERKITAIDAKPKVNEEYNALVDRTHAHTVWTHPGMSTYYRNSRGRVIFVMPFTNLEYWEMTHVPDIDDYTQRSLGEGAGPSSLAGSDDAARLEKTASTR